MQRCLQLAQLGAGKVAPNPMVGAVLVHDDTIIGEGYHQQYGQAHAEVNCINSVSEAYQYLIDKSTLYVSLEPCAHFGKTPPCADLIVHHKIPKVVIACSDSFAAVDGKGIQKLQQAGIEVVTGVLEQQALALNKRFFTFHQKQRPYIILKWAQSKDEKIAQANYSPVKISGDITNRQVHQWRSEEAAILVGANTALHDNPSLTTRLWKGKHPVRLVLDRQLQLPSALQVFDGQVKTIVFNELKSAAQDNLFFHQLPQEKNLLPAMLKALHQLDIQTVLVEGGARLLQSFIDQQLWDEARIITNETLQLGEGINAPKLNNSILINTQKFGADEVCTFAPKY